MLVDVLINAFKNLCAKPAKTLLSMVGTLIAIACLIAISCISETASGQIAAGFNELQATHITVTDEAAKTSLEPSFHFLASSTKTVDALNGVKNSGIYYTVSNKSPDQDGPDAKSQVSIAKLPEVAIPVAQPSALNLMGVDPEFFQAVDAKTSSGTAFNDFHAQSKSRVVVLGSAAAKQLGITQTSVNASVFYGNDAYLVVGILEENNIVPEINTSLLIPLPVCLERYGNPQPSQVAKMIVSTKLGAASQASKEIPTALNPRQPKQFSASVPPDWQKVTKNVSSSVNILSIVTIVITMLSAMISIATISILNVNARKREIGLMKALGSNGTRVFLTFTFEALIIGLVGALIGECVGISLLLTVCFANSWTPILNPLLCITSPLIGAVFGILAALVPAYRASKLNPIVALS